MVNLRLNMRLVLQLPLLFLGSCTPMVPSTSIVIYSVEQPVQIQHNAKPSINRKPAHTVTDKSGTCERMELAVIETYKIPVVPDLSGIEGDTADEVNEAVVKALLDHIDVLRSELRRVMKDYKCSLENIPKT